MFWGKLIYSFYSSTKYSFPITIILFSIGYISSKYFYLPLSIQSGLTSIIFIHAGKKIKEKDILNSGFVYIFLLSLELWISMLFLKGGKMSIVSNFYDNIPANIISGICGSVALLSFCRKIEKSKLFVVFKFIGKYSLIFLCLHIIDLNLFPWGWIFEQLSMTNRYIQVIFMLFAKMFMYFVGCEIIIHSPLKFIYCPERKISV